MQTNRRTLLASLAISAIDVYRNSLSYILLHACRFSPTCSAYAREALERHGAVKGAWRAALRLLRCHPLCRGGFDPVK